MNNTLEGINSRITEAEEQISDREDRMVEISASRQYIGKKSMKKWRDLWSNIKHTNLHILGVPEEDREKGPEKILGEIIAENFPNLGKETVTEVQEVHSPIQDEPKEEHIQTL